MADPADSGSSEYGNANPWLIAVLVSVATFMEVLDTTIANVALRYIAGGLAVSSDEASWVVTTYLVANSIVLAASGWLAQIFGRRNFSSPASHSSPSVHSSAASRGICRRC
jgi:DHA2 family multidrug resistance protein